MAIQSAISGHGYAFVAMRNVETEILCDQVEEITRESRACPTCSKVRVMHDYRTRVFDTLFGRLAVKAARLLSRSP